MRSDTLPPVLVIDDDESVGEEICDALGLRDISALYASRFTQARDILLREKSLCVIVIDFHMPEMTGIEMMERLATECSRPLAFVMLTGDETQSAAVAAIRARAFDFLQKPVDGRLLSDAIDRAFVHIAEIHEVRDSAIIKEAHAIELARRLEVISDKLAHRDRVIRNVMLSQGAAIESVIEDIRAPLAPLLNRLEELRQSLAQSDAGSAQIASSLLADGRRLADLIESVVADVVDDTGKTRAPTVVDLAQLVQRLIPAFTRLAGEHQVKFRSRVPPRLPAIYADETSLSRATSHIFCALVDRSRNGDDVTITAIKEGNVLILTFRVQAQSFDYEHFSALIRDFDSPMQSLDKLDPQILKLVECRVIVHMQGGEVRIDQTDDHLWSVRLIFPLMQHGELPATNARVTSN